MNPEIEAQLGQYIQSSLLESYRNQSVNVFDRLMEKCQLYYDRPAHSLREIKEKMNTKLKGDIFEHFCLRYCREVMGITEVWLLKDVPEEVREKLKLGRNDLGIDLVGRDGRGRFYAVQAKYRKRDLRYKPYVAVGWKELSTFYGLVSRTGPYYRQVIITNADYVRHVGKKQKFKDKSVCYKSLRGIKKEDWVKMAGFSGHSLQSEIIERGIQDDEREIKENEEEERELKKKIVLKEPIRLKTRPLMEDLRARRLAFYEKN